MSLADSVFGGYSLANMRQKIKDMPPNDSSAGPTGAPSIGSDPGQKPKAHPDQRPQVGNRHLIGAHFGKELHSGKPRHPGMALHETGAQEGSVRPP